MSVLRGQHQRLTQMGGILVTIKSGFVRGDLKQNAAGRAEVDCPKIIAIDDRCYLIACHSLVRGQRAKYVDLMSGQSDFFLSG